ncbi:MAG: hypothetical protein SFV51_24230 [Bryobacteraceae bacterium]|nr:hypothetical protein [Bryobacteraceae bacterium]
MGTYNLETLVQWVAGALGITIPRSDSSTEILALRLAKALERQSLYFFLSRAGDFDGGISGLEQRFWLPLQNRLRELRTDKTRGRLVAVFSVPEPPASEEQAAVDYARLIPVPALDDLKDTDVMLWLTRARGMAPKDAAKLVKQVVREVDGEPATPRDVFARLKEYL